MISITIEGQKYSWSCNNTRRTAQTFLPSFCSGDLPQQGAWMNCLSEDPLALFWLHSELPRLARSSHPFIRSLKLSENESSRWKRRMGSFAANSAGSDRKKWGKSLHTSQHKLASASEKPTVIFRGMREEIWIELTVPMCSSWRWSSITKTGCFYCSRFFSKANSVLGQARYLAKIWRSAAEDHLVYRGS